MNAIGIEAKKISARSRPVSNCARRCPALTGTVSPETDFAPGDIRKTIPRFTEENRVANQALVDLVAQIAEAHKASSAQVALAWLLGRRRSLVPIPGTRRLSRLDENIGATRLELSDSEMTVLDEAATRLGVAGDRYNEAGMKMTGL